MAKKDYSKISLSRGQIDAQEHKNHLGGGAAHWQERGAFQLALLQWLGLEPHHSLLDIGCGPLRAGIHFAKHLEHGNYRGVDFNASFIQVAQELLRDEHLSRLAPQVSVLQEFDFAALNRTFDYLLCFSVLNHCGESDRKLFFERVPAVMHAGSRLFITHAGWFDAKDDASLPVRVETVHRSEQDLPAHLAFQRWGFGEPGDRLPVIEFRRRDNGT